MSTFKFSELSPASRINAMQSLRDHVTNVLVDQAKIALEKCQKEDFDEPVGDIQVGILTKKAEYELEQAEEFSSLLEDEIELIKYLRKDTVKFTEDGDVVKMIEVLPEKEKLDFLLREGSFFNSYKAESERYSYTVMCRHGASKYTVIVRDKNDSDKSSHVLLESVGSLQAGFQTCQNHHAEIMQNKEKVA